MNPKMGLLVLLYAGLHLSATIAMAESVDCYGVERKDGRDMQINYSDTTGKITGVIDPYGNPKNVVLADKPTFRRTLTPTGKKVDFYQGSKLIFSAEQDWNDINATITYEGTPTQCTAELDLQPSPKSKAELCAMTKDMHNFQTLLMDEGNRLGFQNVGGLGGGGVCWWFSRFERNAAYVTVFRPDLPKPSRSQAASLIAAIRRGNAVVQIPGYKNLQEFSGDNQPAIQGSLESWQISDGVFGGGWIRGLEGVSITSSAALKKTMDQTFDLVMTKKRVAFYMLQVPGITSHAWLVISMNKTATGYDLIVADSNYAGQNRDISYTYGDTNLNYDDGEPMVPYLQSKYISEEESLIKTAKSACAR